MGTTTASQTASSSYATAESIRPDVSLITNFVTSASGLKAEVGNQATRLTATAAELEVKCTAANVLKPVLQATDCAITAAPINLYPSTATALPNINNPLTAVASSNQK